MIDLARLHPTRIARSARWRLLALAQRHLSEEPESVDIGIIKLTLARLAGRVEVPKFSITYSDRLLHRRDGVYHREHDGYVLELPTMERGHDTISKAWELGPTYLFWMLHCPSEVERVAVTLSDGDAPSGGRFAPSTNRSDIIPVPDPYFFRFSAFENARRHAEAHNLPWHERSGEIVWRGASSGLGTFDVVLGEQWPSLAAQRLELILAARKIPGVDAALTHYLRDEFMPELARQTGVLKDHIDENSWTGRKFAIDVDGQTNTWSNLFIRLLFGCCVLKLDSKYGYRQWYYDRLKPWEHYVPVKADASDLGERIEWLRSNDARAREIAANGQLFARSLSFEAGRREAVELITTHWRD